MEEYQEFVVIDDLAALRADIRETFVRGTDFLVEYRLAIPGEELRWVEYGQRLLHQRRNVAATPARRDVALNLWQDALLGGAQAAGRPVGALVQGRRADLLVLDCAHPNLDGVIDTDVLGRLVFCGNDNLVRDVLAGGHWVVQGGRHMAQEAVKRRYREAIQRLREV